MNAQQDIDFSRKKRDEGMKQALDHANELYEDWEKIALDFLEGFAKINGKFMVEDCRYASQGVVPQPPSARSWGSIILKANRKGWVYKVKGEIEPVKNVKAHRANAQVWRSSIVKY
jgi:hypothetical protein